METRHVPVTRLHAETCIVPAMTAGVSKSKKQQLI
jgi:hypothetical protein